ncbi:MAG: ComF family protein [Anaerolineae bacterium]
MSSGPLRVSFPEILLGSLLNLLFPPRCVVCRRVGTWLCPECVNQLPRLSSPVCQRCGTPITHGMFCRTCREAPLRLEGIRSVAPFRGPVRSAIHYLKYRHARELADPLGELMAQYWQQNPLPAEVIVPVPLHPSRLRRRGYNQAALLAWALGRRVGLPVDEDALCRVRATASQMRLQAADRRRNVENAFHCLTDRMGGRRVLLVDDVCTTGATLEACADALREGGARQVWALTLARTV